MFFNPFSRKAKPLSGAPKLLRLKSYSAQSGYVYQYFYAGRRDWYDAADIGVEHVFQVSADRKTFAAVSVFVIQSAVEAWERGHGRALSGTERYAIAKMALFQAFDERPTPAEMLQEIRVRPADAEGFIEMLGL